MRTHGVLTEDDRSHSCLPHPLSSHAHHAKIKEITENYLKLEEFDYENVNRASKACGPLNKWVTSQLHYSTILRRVQPLRDEVSRFPLHMYDGV